MSRYPYTEAADYIRSRVSEWQDVGGRNVLLPSISRGQASSATSAIAKALGITHEELATRIADYARTVVANESGTS